MLTIYDQGGVSSKAPVQKWVLALGGIGIVFGLALYGYKLIISLGYRMTKVSPSRGFAIELSAAMVVVVASFVGIPISTTQVSYFLWLTSLVSESSQHSCNSTNDYVHPALFQCKVGGTTAVGMFGGKKGVDPLFLLKIVSGWVITFFGVCLIK